MVHTIQKNKVTVPTEEEYRAFQKLGLKLGIPIPMLFLTMKVEKDGEVLSEYTQRSQTWTRNYWNLLLCFVTNSPGVATNFGAGYLSFKNTAAAVAAIAGSNWAITSIGPVNTSTYGIQVGIGGGAENFEGYILGNQCVNGSGSNMLVHAAHSALVQNYDAPSKTWTITVKRLFNNNSGAQIVIAEAALTFQLAATGTNIMVNRDLLGATVNVNNGAQLTTTYLITLTFPA